MESSLMLRRGFAALLLPIALCLLIFDLSGKPNSAQQTDAARIAAGKRVYSGSCGMTYCHAADGVGGGGPKLRDREFTPEYLTHLIMEGVPGTSMPAFKSSLNQQQVANLIAYLLSISKNKGGARKSEQPAPAADPHLNPPPKSDPTPKAATEAPKANIVINDSLDLRGDVEAGRLLFFDSAEMRNCRVCHTVQERGGKVGPDLTELANKSPREILQGIVAPHAAIDEKYAMVAITTRGGERFTGVKRDEDDLTIRLYDTSTLPPVSRAFAKSEVAKVERLNTSAMPGEYASKYSLKQLLDLVSFLKSSSVGLKELF